MLINNVEVPLETLFEQATTKHCNASGNDCYSSTCPINCLAFLLDSHTRKEEYHMLYGDYLLLRYFANTRRG